MIWLEAAACKGMDPNIFYPGVYNPTGVESALAVCSGCTVSEECLEDALEDYQYGQYGIRGGQSERERRRLRYQRNGRSKVSA